VSKVPTKLQVSAGGVAFRKRGRQTEIALISVGDDARWQLPKGLVDSGESTEAAAVREVREETGIDVREGRLVCMDFRRPRPGHPGGIRFLFRCGPIGGKHLATIVVQREEIAEYQMLALPDALPLLRPPIRRRVRAASSGRGLVYLEDGRPVPAAGPPRSRPGTGGAASSPPSPHGTTK